MKLRPWTMKLTDKTLTILKNFDGINNKLAYIHSKAEYDVEAKKITTTREIRKK